MSGKKNSEKQSVRETLQELWTTGFFSSPKSFNEIKTQLANHGSNPADSALQMALSRAEFLTRRQLKGNYQYVQKFNVEKVTLTNEILPLELIGAMGEDFKKELDDLKLNYGKSGTCTAFLLRKILEKLIFLSFVKNGFEDKLKNKNGEFLGLTPMLNMATVCKIQGKPFLMPKTAKEIEGIKFLGDTSAHNPLVNVAMKTIEPVMPFIVTAYSELAKKLN
jgi:hypothetical protein